MQEMVDLRLVSGTTLRGHERAQGAVERLLAEELFQCIHDDGAFAVVEVGLIGDARQRNLGIFVRGTAGEVAIKLELQ
jgi:hypothetical protein